MVESRLIIGLGTGRCGTLSLARLLALQPGCDVRHERFAGVSWYGDPGPIPRIKSALEEASGIWGDIGLYQLPYVNRIREAFPGTKFICLKRDKKATVRSFLRVAPAGSNWFGNSGLPHPWDNSFPDFGDVSYGQGARMYWDYYYETAEGLQSDDFRIYPTESLNDPGQVQEILEFAGVENPDVATGIHAHKGHR